MSYLIAGWDLSIEDKKQFRKSTVEAAIDRALQLGLAQSRHELVVEGLFPSYLGLKQWIVPKHPVGEWFTWIKNKVGSGSIIAITQVSIIFPVTPGINLLRLGRGEAQTTVNAIFSLSSLYSIGPLLKALEKDAFMRKIPGVFNLKSWPIMEGYFSEPVIYRPGDLVNIQLLCDSAAKAGFVLGGFVIEPVGIKVS